MRHIKWILICVFSFNAMASWPGSGNWEFIKPLDVVGDPQLDEAIIFTIYDTHLDNELAYTAEISTIRQAGVEYRGFSELAASLYIKAEAQRKHDLTYFDSLRGFNREEYHQDKSAEGVMFFSHKLGKNITGRVLLGYSDLDKFNNITLRRDWFDCENDHGSKIFNCAEQLTAQRLSTKAMDNLVNRYQSYYGIRLAEASFILYDYQSQDFYAVYYQNARLDKATLYFFNLASGQIMKPISIEEFVY